MKDSELNAIEAEVGEHDANFIREAEIQAEKEVSKAILNEKLNATQLENST